MASRTEVEEKLTELIERLDASDQGARAIEDSLPERRIVALHVPDLDARYWTQMEGGRMGPLQRGDRDGSDIRITAGSDDLVELIDGRGSLFSAYLAGRVRIDASFADLLRLRRLV